MRYRAGLDYKNFAVRLKAGYVKKYNLDKFIKYGILFCFLGCAGMSNLIAGSVSTSLLVSVTVDSQCKMDSNDLQFGTYDPVGANSSSPLNAMGSIKIKCTKNTIAVIRMDGGQHASSSSHTTRAMTNATGSTYLDYELYLDSERSTVWNNSNNATYQGTGDGAITTVAIYGAIPGDQDVNDGQYNDVVTITATF